jgi:hypothetical protein
VKTQFQAFAFKCNLCRYDVVTAVLAAHPGGATETDTKGNLAIHLAAKHGASAAVGLYNLNAVDP